MRAFVVSIVLAASANAHGQTAGEWTWHAAPVANPWGLACADEAAFVRGREASGAAVVRWDGSWTPLAPLPATSMSWGGSIAASPDAHLFVRSAGALMRWDGGAWSTIAIDGWAREEGVPFALSAAEVYLAGVGRIGRIEGDRVASYDAGTWRDLAAVWSPGPSVLFAVGTGGAILRHDERGWARMASGTTSPVVGVWGSGAADVWAWDETGAPLHFDGHAWSARRDGIELVSAIGGAAPDRIYAAGTNGIWRWEGRGWEIEVAQSALEGAAQFRDLRAVCATRHYVLALDRGNGVWIRAR